MLFNSYVFLLAFLPLTLLIYFLLGRLPERFPLNKLTNRIAEVRGAIGKVRVEGGALLLDNVADRIELIDASGAPRLTATHADRLELGTLPAGTYIYKVSKGGDKMTGKVALP